MRPEIVEFKRICDNFLGTSRQHDWRPTEKERKVVRLLRPRTRIYLPVRLPWPSRFVPYRRFTVQCDVTLPNEQRIKDS